jgi:hypothetical protein
MRSSEDKSLELYNKDAEEDELPLCPHIPLLRQRAGIFSDNDPITVYIIKESAELIIDYGQYDANLEENSGMRSLGQNPRIPMNRPHAFKSELKSACHVFFQRPDVRKILRETISIHKDLIEIIVKYR